MGSGPRNRKPVIPQRSVILKDELQLAKARQMGKKIMLAAEMIAGAVG